MKHTQRSSNPWPWLPSLNPPPNPHAYLLHMKPMELVCNALKLSGDLYLCSVLKELSFRGLLPKG